MPTIQRKSLVAAASLVALASILSRVLGYVREVLLAAKFGATNITDAYLVAQEIPSALYYVVSVSLVLAFIPIYREVVQKRGEEPAWRLVNSVLNTTLLFFAGLWLVGDLAAPALIGLLAPGFTEEALALTVNLTRTMLPMLVVVGIVGVTAAVLNANQRFGPPAFFALITNVVLVGALTVVSRPEQIQWIAYAMVASYLIGTVVQVGAMPRLGYRYQLVLDTTDPAYRRLWVLLAPLIVATSVTQVQTLAARFVASHLAEGTISYLSYATRVSALPFTVVGMAVTTVLFPTLAEQGAAGRLEELRETVRGGLRTLAFLLVPMAVGCGLFAEPITRLMFERGAFTPQATHMTALALQFFSWGILFSGWLDMLNRTFYAVQDSVTPMWMALVMMGLNIGLNFLLVDVMGHTGLALSASFAPLVGSLLLLWRLRARMGSLGGWELGRTLLSYLATSLIGAVAGKVLIRVGEAVLGRSTPMQALLLVGALSLILVVHIGAALLLKTPDGEEIRRIGARVMGKVRRA